MTLVELDKKSSFDPEWSNFTLKYCFNELIQNIYKNRLFLNVNTSPEWYKNDLAKIREMLDDEENIYDPRKDLKTFFTQNPIFYKDLKEDSSLNLTLSSYTIPLSQIIELIDQKNSKKKINKFTSDELVFYLCMSIYNSLDDDEGNELWDYINELSFVLDKFYEGKGPTVFNSSLPPISEMASKFGVNLEGSNDVLNSFQSVINKTINKMSEGGELTSSSTFDMEKTCSKISETLSDKDIQIELKKLLEGGKNMFENNKGIGNVIGNLMKMMN